MKNSYNQSHGTIGHSRRKLSFIPSFLVIILMILAVNTYANDPSLTLTGSSICETSGCTVIGLSETQGNVFHALYRYDGATYNRVAVYFNINPGPAIAFGSFCTVGQYVAFSTAYNFPPEISFTSPSMDYTPISGEVIIYAQPLANPGAGGNECDLTFTCDATPSVGTGAWTYTGPGSATFVPSASDPDAVVTVTAYGTYDFTWTETNGLCSDFSVITVNFYEQPVANAGGNGSAVCAAYVYNLNATPSVGTGAWTYTGPGTASFDPSTSAANPIVTVTAYGSYTFTWTETNGTCFDSDDAVIGFYENIIADAGDDDMAACGSLSYTLNGNSALPGVGTWTYTGAGNAIFSDPNSPTATVTMDVYGTHTFTWTIVNGTCTTTDDVDVFFRALPTATLTAVGSTHLCVGGTANFSIALTGEAPWSVTYTDGVTPVTVNGILTSPYTFSDIHNANKTWTITDVSDDNGCSNTGSGTVSVYIGPSTTIGDITNACAGSYFNVPITVTNFDDVEAASLTLNFNPAVLEFDGIYTSAIPAFSINEPVAGTLTCGGFGAGPFSLADGSALFVVQFKYLGGVTTLTWDNSSSESCEYLSHETGMPFCDTPFGSYYVDGSATGNVRPTATLTGTASVCSGGSTDLTIGFTGAAPWTYSINGGTPVTTSDNPDTYTVSPTETTIYAITSLSDALCTAFPVDYPDQVTVTAHPLPAAPVAIDVNVVYDGTTYTGGATPPLGASVVWYDAATGGNLTVAPFGLNVGTYTAWAESVDDITLCVSATRTLVTVSITPRTLNLTGFTGDDKVYDGTTDVTGTGFTDDRVIGDDLTFSFTAAFADKHVGLDKPVLYTMITITGGANMNDYVLASTTGTGYADITPRLLTLSGFYADNKVYDGNTSTTGTGFADDRLSGDDLTFSYTALFEDKMAAIGKNVLFTAITITGGADGLNYTLASTTGTAIADITPKPITASYSADDKVYDGTTAVILASDLISGQIPGDNIYLTYTANFDTKHVGVNKDVFFTGVTINGIDAPNYTIDPNGMAQASITVRDLALSMFVADDKEYDGTTASVNPGFTDDRVAGDDLVFSFVATFADPNVGIDKPVSFSGIAITGGADILNYNLVTTSGTAYADIYEKAVTVQAVTDNKVYDGTTSSDEVPVVTGIIAPDYILTQPIQVFDTKHAGTGKTMLASGLVIADGNGGLNYSVIYLTDNTGVISKLGVSVTAVTDTKVYDGTTASDEIPVVGALLPGDVITTMPVQTFDTKHVGTNKTLTPAGLVIDDGNSGNNYEVTYIPDLTGEVTIATVTVTAQTHTRMYNGNTSSTVVPVVTGLAPGDVITTQPIQTFDTKHAAVGKTLTPSGLVINDGNGGLNYTINYIDDITGVITKRTMNVLAQHDTKVYDGTLASSVSPYFVLSEIQPGDNITQFPVQTFKTKTVGTNKTIEIKTFLIVDDGNGGNNYSITYTNNLTGVITKRTLTLSDFTADNKMYDGTTTVTGTGFTDNRIAGDVLTFTYSAAFADKHAGLAKPVNYTGIVMSGPSAPNYLLASNIGTAYADIAQFPGTVTAQTDSKVYDATTVSAVSPVVSLVLQTGDVMGTPPVQNFDTKHVGVGKTIIASGLVVNDGNGGANYLITYIDDVTGVISPLALTVTAQPSTKVYDGTTASAVVPTVVPAVLDAYTGPVETYDTKNVGTAKLLTPGDLVIDDGNGGNNYTITYVTNSTGVITKKIVAVVAQHDEKVYDGTTASTIAPVVGAIAPGDNITTMPFQRFQNKNVGINKTIQALGMVIDDGNGGANYTITYTNNITGIITPFTLTLSNFVANDKIYDGTTAVTGAGFSINKFGSDIITFTYDVAFADRHAGLDKPVYFTNIVISGGSQSGNYILDPSPASGTAYADITPNGTALTAHIEASDKCYDGTTTATLTNQYVTGMLHVDDVVTLLVSAADFDTDEAGVDIIVTATGLTLGGTESGNYTLSSPEATTTADIFAFPDAIAEVTSPIACNGGTGTVTITVLEGTEPYLYTFNGVGPQTSNVFTDVPTGVDLPWSVTANGCGPLTGTLTVTEPTPITVSGVVNYYNTANTPMNNVTIELKQNGVTINTAITSGGGLYSFSNVCPGNYDVVASTSAAVGGINITDAALVNAWSVTPSNIEKVKFYAGDVVLNNRLEASDAGRIQQYFMQSGNPTWADRGAWTFWPAGDMISANPTASTDLVLPTLTVNPLDPPLTMNLLALVTGDFNRSFTPSGSKTASENLHLSYGQTRIVERNAEFELPVYVTTPMEVGAISVIMTLPEGVSEITGAYLGDNTNIPVNVSVNGNEMRIGWNALSPVSLKAGDRLFTLMMKVDGSVVSDNIRLTLAADPLNELANGEAQVISDAVIVIDVIGTKASGIGSQTSVNLGFANYPNPFAESTTFVCTLPFAGKATIEMFDMTGRKLTVVAAQDQPAGEHRFILDASSLAPGVYTAILTLKTDDQVLTRTIKVIRNR